VSQLGLFGGEPAPGEVAPAIHGDELRALAAGLPAAVYLGTSSWSFPGWSGLVYAGLHSEAVLARKGLPAYGRHPLLRTVGVDRTHYAPVAADVLAAYARDVPGDFRFVVKAHELCSLGVVPSHPRYGDKRGQGNPLFFDAAYARDAVVAPFVDGLGARAGALLFQLAPQPIEALGGSPRRFAEKLYRFLRDLPKGPRYAVEIRNAQLLTADYAAALRHGGGVHCFAAHPTLPPLAAQQEIVGEQPAAVVRWLLPRHHAYETAMAAYQPFDRIIDPDPPARAAIASLVIDAARRGAPSWVIVNNHAEGSAPLSIVELARRIASDAAAAGAAAGAE
jgi:uncharacterized protein YecE (DUF72 family)